MADYQKMYTTLFNAMTDAISTLQEAQKKTEEMYISTDEPLISILPHSTSGEQQKQNESDESGNPK